MVSYSSLSLVSGALLLSALVACGGSVALDDIPRDVDGGSGAGNGNGSGNGNGTGAGNGSATGGGSGSVGGTGPTSPGSPGVPPVAIDASAPPKPTVIACGQSSCSSATQSCCITQAGDASCIAKGGLCAGVPLDCSSGASCPGGQVCCLDIQGLPNGAACTPLGSCDSGPSPNGGPSSVILCDSDAECPQGMRCRDAPGDVGIKFCRPRRNGGGSGGGGGGGGSGGGN